MDKIPKDFTSTKDTYYAALRMVSTCAVYAFVQTVRCKIQFLCRENRENRIDQLREDHLLQIQRKEIQNMLRFREAGRKQLFEVSKHSLVLLFCSITGSAVEIRWTCRTIGHFL